MAHNGSLLARWRSPCAYAVTQNLLQSHAAPAAVDSTQWPSILAQDAAQMVDSLDVSLQCEDPAPYHRHLLWYRDVVQMRGLESRWIGHLTKALAQYWRDTSDCEYSAHLLRLLDTAPLALETSTENARFGHYRLAPLAQAAPFRNDLLQGRQNQAVQCVIQAMDDGASLAQASVQIIQPAMYAIGDLWQQHRISVAQEHLATAISQNALVAAYLKASFLASNGKKALFACVEGNHHALGLRMVSDAVECQGWETQYLGADVPMGDLVRSVDTHRPQLLGLSVSMSEHLATARRTVDLLHAELGSACPTIWVGGLATCSSSQAWRITGADGFMSDAEQALHGL